MNEANLKFKQQVVDKIKSATNILITVSNNPSVDELSAALGLTTLLDKLDKHATAIFSGIIPPAINFLNPDAIFENNADSLRDFIIALDKDKADHLRYKLDGDVVKIFITPYRTKISDEDLEFSQGDYNVELVLALGVTDQEHLDGAIVANGQIMDDATIITISAGTNTSNLGSIDWHDDKASCLSEMVASLAAGLKNNGKTLLDKQVATALLTGIVAATDRFSNGATSSSVMTSAAELMAAGADQQLIAAKLQESHAIQALPTDAGTTSSTDAVQPEASEVGGDGSLVISHVNQPSEPKMTTSQKIPKTPIVPPIIETPKPDVSVQPEIAPTPSVESSITAAMAEPINEAVIPDKPVSDELAEEPSLGGTLNATTDEAEEENKRELEEDKNKTILSHAYVSDPNQTNAINGNMDGASDESTASVDPFAGQPAADNNSMSTLSPDEVPPVNMPMPPAVPDFSNHGEKVITPPSADAMPGVSTLPPEAIATTAAQATTSGIPNVPPIPGVPDDVPEPTTAASTLPPEQDTQNPGQFKIPGQN